MVFGQFVSVCVCINRLIAYANGNVAHRFSFIERSVVVDEEYNTEYSHCSLHAFRQICNCHLLFCLSVELQVKEKALGHEKHKGDSTNISSIGKSERMREQTERGWKRQADKEGKRGKEKSTSVWGALENSS